ncbi:hypothetical protein C8R44DRAFT_902801 [Mycena epipterygia]|nr:hypothetical protein C8R44DRAFT_902801 [Mycena epipterygia]
MYARSRTDVDFRQALIDHGIIEALTGAAVECCLPVLSLVLSLFDDCVWHTYQYILAPCGHNLITKCLRAGFLKWFFAWGKGKLRGDRKPSDESSELLWLLAISLVYLPVLTQLQASIDDLGFPVDANSFKGFPISHKWQQFWSIFERRRELMQAYLNQDMESAPSRIACDNVAACQAYDWRSGGHPQACKSLSHLRRNDGTNATARDRSFFRALLHDDYSRLKTKILTSEVEFLRSKPGAECYVMFDYCGSPDSFTPCDVSVRDMSDLLDQWPMWSDCVRRAAESKGRMRIHVVAMAGDGGYSSVWMFPLRSSTADLVAGVEKIATEIGDEDSESEVERRIQRLVNLEITEIHS